MRRFLSFLLPLFLPGLGVAAHATVITAGTYTLANAYVNGYSVTGTVTFNSAGSATGADLTLNDPEFSNPGLPTFTGVSSTSVYNGLSQNYLSSASNAGQVALFLNTTADANGWFDLCLGNALCGTSAGTVDPSTLQIYGFYNSTTHSSNPGLASTQFSSGYLRAGSGSAPAAVTPEPSTLVLLGTGLFGLGGAAVRARRGASGCGVAAMA